MPGLITRDSGAPLSGTSEPDSLVSRIAGPTPDDSSSLVVVGVERCSWAS